MKNRSDTAKSTTTVTPVNLAYTAIALPLHTGLANQEIPPGYQFLHCLANESQGAESTFF
ncbi:TauD/TfdA family dioxygenase [Oceanobacter sp. 3_MG-2023]|uniref:TauD/TfdA family dioxygenase n=1 Tax=Oceanobacter sp. 3_MG-2023 TaxID=3062622 RepID=UPI00351E4BC7